MSHPNLPKTPLECASPSTHQLPLRHVPPLQQNNEIDKGYGGDDSHDEPKFGMGERSESLQPDKTTEQSSFDLDGDIDALSTTEVVTIVSLCYSTAGQTRLDTVFRWNI